MFDIHVEELDTIVIIHMAGNLYAEEIFRIKNIWRGILTLKPKTIAINCSELDYIDSTAIANLINFSNEARERDINLILYNLKSTMYELLNKVKLDRFFNILTKEDFEFDYLKK